MVGTSRQFDATRWTLDSTGNQTAVDIANSFGSNSYAWHPGAPGQNAPQTRKYE